MWTVVFQNAETVSQKHIILLGHSWVEWRRDLSFWNGVLLLLYCVLSLTRCFPPQQQSTQWVSQRVRPLSGLVFIYLFVYSFPNSFCLIWQPFLAFSCVLNWPPFFFLLFSTFLFKLHSRLPLAVVCVCLLFTFSLNYLFIFCLLLAARLLLYCGWLLALRDNRVNLPAVCGSKWPMRPEPSCR